MRIAQAVDDVAAREGRSPSVREIAEAADLSIDDVLDALAAGSAQRPAPLACRDGGRRGRGHRRGPRGPGFEQAEARARRCTPGCRSCPRASGSSRTSGSSRADAVPDRRAGRCLPDARLAPDPAGARAAARERGGPIRGPGMTLPLTPPGFRPKEDGQGHGEGTPSGEGRRAGDAREALPPEARLTGPDVAAELVMPAEAKPSWSRARWCAG